MRFVVSISVRPPKRGCPRSSSPRTHLSMNTNVGEKQRAVSGVSAGAAVGADTGMGAEWVEPAHPTAQQSIAGPYSSVPCG